MVRVKLRIKAWMNMSRKNYYKWQCNRHQFSSFCTNSQQRCCLSNICLGLLCIYCSRASLMAHVIGCILHIEKCLIHVNYKSLGLIWLLHEGYRVFNITRSQLIKFSRVFCTWCVTALQFTPLLVRNQWHNLYSAYRWNCFVVSIKW